MNKKHLLSIVILAIAATVTVTSCGPKCKQCHAEVLGVASPDQKFCGEELERALKVPGMVCK